MENNEKTGWIKLHRKIQDTKLYPKNRPFTQFEAWIDLLLNANHKDNEVIIGNEIFICKRGQSIRTQLTLSKKWNWSRHKVRGFIDLLQKCAQIDAKTTQKMTMITICNYDNYQSERPTEGQQKDIKRTSKGHKQECIKNEKNEKNPIQGDSNFFESIVFLFKEIYEEIKCIPYAVTKKDYSAAGEVVKLTKDASGITEEEKLKENLQAYFRQVIDHPDKFQKEHMTLSYLANNFNTVNNTFQSKSGGDINSFIKRIAKNQGIEIPQDGVWNRDTRTASEKTYFADNRTPPQPPNFIEVEKYFAENGRSTWEANRAYEHFNKWNWKNKAGESIISRWEEVASMLFFPGGKLYKSEFSTGKKVTM